MNKVDELEEEISKIQFRIKEIQNYCSHPPEAVDQVNHSASGYSEPTEYWATYTCGLCHKSWTGGQHELKRR